MSEPRFTPIPNEPNQVPELEPGLLSIEDATDRIAHLQDRLNGLHDVLTGQRSSYGMHEPNARIWLQKIDAIETTLNRFNVTCALYSRALARAKEPVVEKDFQPRFVELRQLASQIAHQINLLQIEAKSHTSVETNRLPETSIQLAGASKPAWVGEVRFAQHKLGKYGQDVVLIDRHKGSGVVADGTSTMPDSALVAATVARVAESVLHNIPEEITDDLNQVQWYAEAAIQNTILSALHDLPLATIGSTTLFAARHLKKFDVLVVIEIGDCEAVLATATGAERISRVVARKGDIPHIQKLEGRDAKIVDPERKPLVRIVRLADFRRNHPNEPIHLVASTDGFINNAGEGLAQQASRVVRDGAASTVQRVGSQADDLVLFDMELTATAA